MQKLLERKTYTSKSTPHALGSVRPWFCEAGWLAKNNLVADKVVMQALKTSDNSPDEALTPTAQGGQNCSVKSEVSVIYVLNSTSDYCFPCFPVLIGSGHQKPVYFKRKECHFSSTGVFAKQVSLLNTPWFPK